MDGLTFLEWFFILAAGASIIGVPLAFVSRKNNKEMKVILHELKAILHELIESNRNIASIQAENHKETMHVLKETSRIIEANHKETIHALKETSRVIEANHKETMQVLDKIVELFKRNFKNKD